MGLYIKLRHYPIKTSKVIGHPISYKPQIPNLKKLILRDKKY